MQGPSELLYNVERVTKRLCLQKGFDVTSNSHWVKGRPTQRAHILCRYLEMSKHSSRVDGYL